MPLPDHGWGEVQDELFNAKAEGVTQMGIHRPVFSFVMITLILGSSLAMASEGGAEGIGFYTAVAGQVSVTHSGEARVLPVKLHDQVQFKDVIQTQDESRTKAFFQDDSMLTVGENSRVEIDEYIYNPEENVRLAIVKLMQGQVRALVSKVFKANGSKFEIHTPSAVAAARGTYFTVWVENGQSGIINIGEKGRVDFTSGGTTVAVDPGLFSIAYEGKAPSIPMPHYLGVKNGQSGSTMKSTERAVVKRVMTHDGSPHAVHSREKAELELASSPAGLAQGLAAVERTTLREAPPVELPAQALHAMNHEAHLAKALTILSSLPAESLRAKAEGKGQDVKVEGNGQNVKVEGNGQNVKVEGNGQNVKVEGNGQMSKFGHGYAFGPSVSVPSAAAVISVPVVPPAVINGSVGRHGFQGKH
jgi:hypothetical protein